MGADWPSERQPAPEPAESSSLEPSILIVDDDKPSRMALAELLNAPGRNTVVARSGEEALRFLLKQDFAVVILDVQMPGIDGFQTAKMIRERERSRHTPIIFLTASYQDQESVFRGYEAGAVDYIMKPPDADVLRSKVTVFVDLYLKNALLRREVAERKLIEEQLRTSQESLRALAAHLQSVREEERTRISTEIHDQLGQELTGLKIELKWIASRLPKSPRTLTEKAESTLALIDQTIQSVRRIASGLRPAVPDEAGLVAAVEWQVRDFRKRTGIRCKLVVAEQLPELDQDQATALLRVCQELLTNVARHAEASRAEITMRAERGIVSLSVEDNGKGVGQVALDGPKSLGFLGMRERVRPLGGKIEVDPARAKGTKVTVSLPLGAGS